MSLRYRLFLWVSGLFVVISICAYFTENYVTQHELIKAQKGFAQEILDNSEKRRLDLQNFLTTSIAEDAIRLDAILNNISSFSPQALRFGPTRMNEKNGTWGDASDLLLEYKWIDFIQNTNQGKTTAALIPQQEAIASAYRETIDEDLAWVFMEDSKPYLAVKIPYSSAAEPLSQMGPEIIEKMSGVVPEAFFLFDVELLKRSSNVAAPIFDDQRTWPPIAVKWTEGYELDVEPFVKAFQRGRDLLLTKKIQPPQYTAEEINKKMDGAAGQQDGVLTNLLLSPISEDYLMKKKVEQVALRYTQINMIWVLVAMYDSGVFGKNVFSFPSPYATTVFSTKNAVGVGIDTKSVLFSNKIFDDAAYYHSNASENSHSNLATSLAVIPSPTSNHVFFGNTAQFIVKAPEGDRSGYLTLGIDADSILERLVLAVHRTAVLVYNGMPLSAFGEGGEKMDILQSCDLPFSEMLKETSGLVSWNNENYFYMRVQPFPQVDLYFFILNLESREFALLRDFQIGSQRVIDSIRLNIHISGFIALLIAIVVLHNISRNITKPIIQLADATKDVAEGRFEDVKLSLPPQKHNDEIAVLCHSFDEMVKGLIEREKVKGVLNKVVSNEIAQEILKGSIHLGGEEKKVTVLFADIRDFTKMTQSMQPQEVIDLLNTCMTKISQVIDKNKGVIDKYVGDEAMALFGAPLLHGEDAFNAIRSAVEIMEAMRQWNELRVARGEPLIELGIGIHTGGMLAGNMGAENRLNYTVIGSNVNLASRLCSSAKRMEILITKDTLDEPFVKDRVIYEALPKAQFKGFDNSVDVYSVLGLK